MYHNKLIAYLLIFFFLTSYLSPIPSAHASQKDKKKTLAVYELIARNVDAEMVATLSDILRDTIFQTRFYDILTREDMKRILDNLAEKQKIEPDCETDACLAEIAGALGVEKIVVGSVGKVGETYVINLRLVDTQLARTINTVNLNVSSVYAEDVLVLKIKEAGLMLLNIKATKPLQKVYTTERGEVIPAVKKSSCCLLGEPLELLAEVATTCLGVVLVVALVFYNLTGSKDDETNQQQDSVPAYKLD